MASDQEFAALIHSARQGDEFALTALLSHYRPALKLIAELEIGKRLQRRADASDIVQQTQLEAFESIRDFRGSSEPEFSAWIKTILRHRVSNAVRDNLAGKRDVSREQYLDKEEGPINVTWLTPGRGRFATASRHVIKAEAALKLINAMGKLSEDQRLAIRMRHLQGQSIEEIAKHMEKTTASVAGLLRRGMQALRDQVEGDTSWM